MKGAGCELVVVVGGCRFWRIKFRVDHLRAWGSFALGVFGQLEPVGEVR